MSFGPSWQRILEKSPVFARELRQGLRTGRTILLLVVLAILLGLIILGIGSAFGLTRGSPQLGAILFQVFFSLAYFAVAIIGPGLAAAGIASEKDSRTWDALVLTRMNVRAVVRGKFWTAAAALAAFLVMIAPSSLLTLYLGGVGVGELVAAFALMGVIASIAVAFGLSVGAAARGAGAATLAATVSALVAAPLLYMTVGFGMSFLAHATWADVPAAHPVWLPLAYAKSHFDGWYVLLLFALPLVLVTLGLWLFYELTIARISAPSEDRASGLKRWYLTALPCVTGIAAVPGYMTRGAARLGVWLGGLGGLVLFLTFAALLLAGDDLAPSQRVEFRWRRTGARWLTRVLGPGLVQTYMLVLVASLLSVALFTLGGAGLMAADGERGVLPSPSVALLACGEYWSAFLVFVIGFLVWSRMRAGSAAGARLLATMVAAVALAAPWIAFLIFGYAASRRVQETLLIAAPSPLYTFAMVSAIERGEPHLALTSGLACSLGWLSMGLVLLGLGARRATRAVAEQRTERAHLDDQIAHETQVRAFAARGALSRGVAATES